MINSYVVVSLIGLTVILWGARLVYQHKDRMSEMCCMMTGMIFGMIVGFFVGAMHVLWTGNYLAANISGAISGLAAGITIGKYGGPLSRMEGVMAGPMGGIMGAMFGQMISFYSHKIVMLFLVSFVMLIIGETVYMIYKFLDLRGKIDIGFVSIVAVCFLALTGFMSYGSVNTSPTGFFFSNAADGTAPSWAQWNLRAGEVKTVLSADGSSQQTTLRVERYGYSPEKIVAKKGVPLTLVFDVTDDAGCGRSLLISSQGIQKILSTGKNEVTFTPTETGVIPFSCSMNMFRGSITVVI